MTLVKLISLKLVQRLHLKEWKPNLFIIKSYEDNLLYTACAWATHIPILLPAVDHVTIQKKYKKLFCSIEASGVAQYNMVIEKSGFFFVTSNSKYQTSRCNGKQKEADKMEEEFNSLVINKTTNEFGSGVAKDSFVNVPQ